MKQQFPDYNNCIANLPVSILKYFGIDEGNATLHLLDPYLEKEYENIVVLLLDGMDWDCYYPQIDKNVTVFLNVESGTESQAADYNMACGF